MENWKTMLDDALKENGESWADVEANTMTEEDMAKTSSAEGAISTVVLGDVRTGSD